MRALVGLALVVAVACGPASSQSYPPLPSPPTEPLAKWKDFPANAKPRPIIAFGDSLERIQPSGFPNNDRKLAWICNLFVLWPGVTLSNSAPAAATAEGASFPAISSAQAYAELMTVRSGGGNPTDCARVQPFAITAARWTTAGFPTDRGTMQMSAWVFDVPEANAYFGHVGLDESSFWGGHTRTEGRGARVSADGRTLKIPVGNAEPGPCGFDYTASAVESDSAVAVAVQQVRHPSPTGPVFCPLVYRITYVSIALKAPLGSRVLVDEHGNAGAACPEFGDC